MSDELSITEWGQRAPHLWEPPGRMRTMARSFVITAAEQFMTWPADKFLRLLYCHYVFDDQREKFERIIERLRRHGTFVSTSTCIAMLEGKKPIDGKYFHLSFDDGFRNIITNAFPILKRQNVPAIFFVPTSLIEADAAQTKHYCLITTKYPAVIGMAGWDDLRRAVDAGFEIGSHTKTHARLSDISGDPQRMRDEVLGSKQELERRLGVACNYISWPYGTMRDIDAPSLSSIEHAGYRACFSAVRGAIVSHHTDRFRIPRHHFEAQWPMSHIEYFAQGHNERNASLLTDRHSASDAFTDRDGRPSITEGSDR
jgi:peptidoglycan/xylan/chitin deacetylase (PgdA/CDA1 family)